MAGPYLAPQVANFVGKPGVGFGKFKGQCAALVQWFGGCPKAGTWVRGVKVRGANLSRYTCIATFDDQGRYGNSAHGNHAAIYHSQDSKGILVYDQWEGIDIQMRTIYFRGGNLDPSNNGDCFYVIM